MQFIFPSAMVLERHVQAQKDALGAEKDLLQKLGVKTLERKYLTFLIISKDVFHGFEIMIELMETCEKTFKKKIDMTAIRFEMFPSIERAAKNPVVEIASFIYFADDDLQDISEYPELLEILPFL